MGEPSSKKDSQKASSTRSFCTIFSKSFHEGTAKPVYQTAKPTASSKQTKVKIPTREIVNMAGVNCFSHHCLGQLTQSSTDSCFSENCISQGNFYSFSLRVITRLSFYSNPLFKNAQRRNDWLLTVEAANGSISRQSTSNLLFLLVKSVYSSKHCFCFLSVAFCTNQ